MAAKGKSNKDIYRWVKKVIMTCDDPQQLVGADKLAELFLAKLTREKHPTMQTVRRNLYSMFVIKLHDLID
jgi:hypothetical protein